MINSHLAVLAQQLGGQINPQIQAQITQQITRQMAQQLNPQIGSDSLLNTSVPQTFMHNGPWNPPAQPLPFHNAAAHQQQVGVVAIPPAANNLDSSQILHSTSSTSPRATTADTPSSVQGQGTSPGTAFTVVHESQGPDGTQWRMVINASTTASLSPRVGSNQESEPTNVSPDIDASLTNGTSATDFLL